MGVDEAEGRALLFEVDEDAGQDRVLDDVGEIAGVEGVAVVHYGGRGDVVVCALTRLGVHRHVIP